MSHFPVAVIVPDGVSLNDLLAPYQENNMGDCPKKYMEFVDTEDEHRKEYETDFNKEYNTFEEYMRDYHGYDARDPEKGRYGYWENPNAKWDWWQTGGRFSGWFKDKKGQKVNECQVSDLDRTPDEAARARAARFWEIVVEGSPLRPGEEKPINLYKVSYYLEQYGTKENYAAELAGDAPWAFISPDGVWHEKGKMGWFTCSDANQDKRKTFIAEWEEALAAAPDNWVVLVDCHI